MDSSPLQSAFPFLTPEEMDLARGLGERVVLGDGQHAFDAGTADLDLFVVESGMLDVVNPVGGDSLITTHGPGEFAGDIDLLTGRPVIVTAIARGPETVLLRVPNRELRRLLGRVPRLSEKLMTAFQVRRGLLEGAGVAGLKVVGPALDADTMLCREFLHKNFVPHIWTDPETDAGRAEMGALGVRENDLPAVRCADGSVLRKPSLRRLAGCAGLRRTCPDKTFDVAIIGAGPAGMTAGVYAASEGLSTIVIDSLGPGGQAAGSSLIENFIGFPSGLSGTELATRGVLQLLKFGASLLAPVKARELRAGDEVHEILTDGDEAVKARIVLCAGGVRWRRLEAPGARRFERSGIYYAATSVEARVCAGREVVVVGGGNSAGQAAMYLAECACTVHLVIRKPTLGDGMSDYLSGRIRVNDRVKLHTNAEVVRVLGDDKLGGVEIEACDSHERSTLPCEAMFVFIGAEPHAGWLPDSVARDDDGYLLVGDGAQDSGRWPLTKRRPKPLETSLPRVLAAGDVRAGGTKRVAFAVGDGAMAVTCAHQILHGR